MSSRAESDRMTIRHEINVALFWRRTIGDDEYTRFEPDDMLRWYEALELRGDVEIRELMRERFCTAGQRTPVVGLVLESPHPPAWLVREWLEAKVPKVRIWMITNVYTAWLICALIGGSFVYGCQHLEPYNTLVWKAPFNQPPMMSQAPGTPTFGQSAPLTPPPTFAIPVRPPVAPSTSNASGAGGAQPASGGGSSATAPP